jgi:Tol biopolymer transport system component
MKNYFSTIQQVLFIFLSCYTVISNGQSFKLRKFVNTDASWSPDGKQIVFASVTEGKNQIYVINKNGTGLKRLTETDAEEMEPTFSPDGKKILFISKRDGLRQIFIMNSDGSEQKNLLKSSANEFDVCWSPLGDKIAFHSTRDNTAQIYMMNTDGSNLKRISNLQYNNSFPKWSPDEKKIIFSTIRIPEVLSSIYNVDSSIAEPLQFDQSKHFFVDGFSRDSKKILYHSIDAYSIVSSTGDLFIYDMTTGTSRKIKSGIDRLSQARFVNDDSVIYVTDGDLYLYNINNGKKNKLAKNVGSPQLSPDKSVIVFVSLTSITNICTVSIDGTNLKNLTQK